MPEYGKSFGERLKAVREDKNLTQGELGALLGTSKQVISRYEMDKRTPKVSVAAKMAQVLDVDLAFLLGDDIPLKKPAACEDSELENKKRLLLSLFDEVPPESQGMVIEMIEAALKSQGLL